MRRTLFVALLGLATLSGCNNQPRTEAAADSPGQTVNSLCPIGRHEWDGSRTRPASLSRQWKGTTVGFCCKDCVDEFDSMTDAEKDQVRAAAIDNRELD